MTELETALSDFISLHEDTLQAQTSPHPESRTALKTRLAAESRSERRPSSWLPSLGLHDPLPSWQLAGAGLALVIVTVSLFAIRTISPRVANPKAMNQLASALPRKVLTPGVARTVQVDTLCHTVDSENDPPLDPSLQQAVFSEYGVPVSSKDGYQVDYLISPTLGGTGDIQNLWPEPYSTTSWGARAKDELEDRLHELVCQGKLPLATAQDELATDWIAAYKRYFHTDTPLTNAAALTAAGAPDEGKTRQVAVLVAPVL